MTRAGDSCGERDKTPGASDTVSSSESVTSDDSYEAHITENSTSEVKETFLARAKKMTSWRNKKIAVDHHRYPGEILIKISG